MAESATVEYPGAPVGLEPEDEDKPNPTTDLAGPDESGAYQAPSTLGAHYWFDVPTMLLLLVLGALATSYALYFGQHTVEEQWAIILLGVYASGVALSLLDTIVKLRKRKTDRRWSGKGLPIVFNFVLDVSFVLGIVLVNPYDESALTLMMLTLVGVRFLAHVAGTGSRATPLVLTLPLLFLLVQEYYSPAGRTGGGLMTEVLIMTTCLLMVYAIVSNLNRRIADEAGLEMALAEREQRLRESRLSAQQDAERLAEQVLRLDLLQDGIRAMNSAIELPELLQMVVNNAVRVLNVEQSSIGLIDPQTGELVIQCATGVDSSELQRRRFLPGIGVAGWVVQHGKPLIVEDVRRDIRYVDPYTEGMVGRTTRSMLCVPLWVERKVIGSLCVTHSQPNALTEDHQALLTTFAEQAALAVHKSQLLEERTRAGEELRRRGELISSLNSIGQSVLSSLERKQVLETIMSRISELSSFDHGAIYLVNERTGQEELVASQSRGRPSSAALHPDLALRPGTTAMDLWDRSIVSGTAQTSGPQISMLCLPLVNLGRPLGCILLARDGANPFNEVEVDTAEKLADAVTIAIVNAGLFSRVSEQQEQTSALYRLMLRVNAAPNRRQLAQVIAQELQHISRATAAALLVNDPGQGRISVWATCGDWANQDVRDIHLPVQGDPFVTKVLTAAHQMESPGLLLVHNAPQEVKRVFGSHDCITIPLVQSGRIYGLLVLEPGTDPPILEDIRETVSLAISHSTVALERAELFEQTLQSARQSSMLYSIAAEVQTSLDQTTVVQMTINGALEALPIESCELYLFDDGRKSLRRVGRAIAHGVKKSSLPLGHETVSVTANPSLAEVLRSPGLVRSEGSGLKTESGKDTPAPLRSEGEAQHSIILGRLMGSEEPLGILRLTTTMSGEEFVRQHATFCQTLLSHSGGALERSRLYTTTAEQARMLQQRAQQLTDILNLGILSAADVPLPTLMPRIAAGVARSLGFSYVRIGEIGPDAGDTEVWAYESQTLSGVQGSSTHTLTMDDLERLMDKARPVGSDAVMGFSLDEALLAEVVPGQPVPAEGAAPKPLTLIMLESTSGGTLGYLLAAQDPQTQTDISAERDLLELLSIYALRISLIIENHRVYSQLLDSKRKIEAVVLSISDGVIVADADLNVLISNSLADQIMGVPPGGSQGYPLKWLITNEDLTGLLRECIEGSTSNVMDVDLRLGREVRTYQAVTHPITAPELGVVGAVLTLRDVTVERATERAKSDFLSIVSHELRTPLNSVMGFLDIVLMNKTGPLTDLQSDFLNTAKQEALVLQRLINDLLDASQLQSGILRLEMAPLNLSSVVERVVSRALPMIVEERLTVVNNVRENIVVVGDEIRLEQVFKNLLDNAAKFTDNGGEIRFECQTESDTVTISVVDNGCGIPPAQLGDVFERFFQAENNSHKFKRGLGLGLAICKNIVDAHGGRIWIESELNVGTRVHVELVLFKPESDLYDFDPQTGTARIGRTSTEYRVPSTE
ncbi:MAG: GAF domain-containing protein [Chloroflexia bacterium]